MRRSAAGGYGREEHAPRMVAAGLWALLCLGGGNPADAAGSALSFDGTDDYVDLGNPADFQLTGAMTAAAWVKINSFDSNGRIISKQGYSGNRSWSLNVEDGGWAAIQFSTNGNDIFGADNFDTGTPLPTGQWVHVAGVFEPGTAVRIYVDGALAWSETDNIPSSHHNNGLPVRIGRRSDGCCAFDGAIDEVRLYNRALTAQEIADQYNNGAGQYGAPESGLVGGWHFDEGSGTVAADLSGNGHDGTLTNGPTWVDGHVDPGGGGGDTTPPTGSVSINGGAAETNTTSVTLTLSATDDSGTVAQMQFSNDDVTYSAAEPYGATKAWTLTAGDGVKTVYVKYADPTGNWSAPVTDTITLDTAAPSLSITSPADGDVIIATP